MYDIFSNNHEVIGEDGRIYDLGSFRGSGGFLASFFANHFLDYSEELNYMDFYMGSIWIKDRGDLTPFYEYIFQKLKDRHCDWRYFFPRMFAVDTKKLVDNPQEDDLENYKPEEEVRKQIEGETSDKNAKELQEELDKAFRAEYEEAKYKPLIPLVQAYKNVYGHLPEGHPQKEFE